ncbi:MAG: YeeE/YedE family protein, partial [Deltaproteobacteria bacterium]|nr:YeeE/YedE family protein [Deltaproteobacteria bacterium]
GFVLQKAGAANPQKIIGMLRLRDFHLMKAILLGIGSSSLGLFLLLAAGLVPVAHLGVKSSYVGVVVGGAILGVGWALAGFCPGTGVVAVGAGRRDAWSFTIGGLVGAFIFMLVYGRLQGTVLFHGLGGKATLAATGSPKFPALFPAVPGLVVAGVIAAVFILAAWLLPAGEKS